MAYVVKVPLSEIQRAVVYENQKKLPLSKIVEKESPDLAITGVFYDPRTWRAVCPAKADGKVLYTESRWAYHALAWDAGPDMTNVTLQAGGTSEKRNYMANCTLIVNQAPEKPLYYNDDVRGKRGRAAVGLTSASELLFFASTDGSSDAATPETLRDYLAGSQNCTFAIMMDGGRKVNFYDRANNILVEGKDPSQNLILIWLNKNPSKEEEKSVDIPIHGYSKSKDGSKKLSANFKVREFACSDGSDPIFIAPELVNILQKIRDHFGKPVNINSAYRTPAKNKAVGGATHSQHLYGIAADISIPGISPKTVAAYAETLLPNTGGIGIYKTFTHIDVRRTKSRWNG
jgi:hypothetical protein